MCWARSPRAERSPEPGASLTSGKGRALATPVAAGDADCLQQPSFRADDQHPPAGGDRLNDRLNICRSGTDSSNHPRSHPLQYSWAPGIGCAWISRGLIDHLSIHRADQMHIALWKWLSAEGHDACRFHETVDGWMIEGTAVFDHAGNPAALTCRLVCDGRWFSRMASISGWVGKSGIDLLIERASGGGRSVNGKIDEGLKTLILASPPQAIPMRSTGWAWVIMTKLRRLRYGWTPRTGP